jgi:hypothetical protein
MSGVLRGRGAAAAGLVLIATAGCVGPARTSTSYKKKAEHSASEARSAVETGRLAARAATRGKAFGPYLSVLLAGAERSASDVQTTFDSIQPPDSRSDQLRQQLDDLLTAAVSGLSELRIAARRGELDELAGKAEPLADLSARLDQFEQAQKQ